MNDAPTLTFAFEIRAEVAPPLHIGHGSGERTEFTPITGGTVRGPRLNGTVIAGGGDWSETRGDVCQLEARYLLRADDGTVIDIVNRGYYVESEAGVYFRTAPVFRTDAPAHRWLTSTVFVGLAHAEGDEDGDAEGGGDGVAIVIRCYSLD
ncbi:DUF3237 domain-containing protein [Streptomyces sp. NPDC050095]|uniref:DUF3237 domain-containing protein n=1 Tax=unclassified Streptomyces TaxID=2593676 RepID=UPI003443EF1B